MSNKKEITKTQGRDIAHEIDPKAVEIINKLPEDQKKVIMASMTVAEYKGPIPPPSLLKQYNEILPDAANRILTMAEVEQKERHKSINWLVKSSVVHRFLGVIFGVVIIFAILYLIYLLAMNDHDTLAGTLATVTIISIASVFFLNKEPNSGKEKNKK